MNVASTIFNPIKPAYYVAPGLTEFHRFGSTKDEDAAKIIQAVVCDHFKVSPEFITGKGRKRERVKIRQIFIYLLRNHTGLSLTVIGSRFEGDRKYTRKDHSTVIHACQTVKDLMDTDPDYKREVEMIEGKL